MSELKDYYALLGVRHDATPGEIKAAYVQASTANENSAGSGKVLYALELDVVYDTLSDPELRRMYDRAIKGDPLALRMAPAGWFVRGEQSNAPGTAGVVAPHPWEWAPPNRKPPTSPGDTRIDRLAKDAGEYLLLGVIACLLLVLVAAWLLSDSSLGFMLITLAGWMLVALAGFQANGLLAEYVRRKEAEGDDAAG